MYLNQKTLEKLRTLLDEETEHHSGHQLVQFSTIWGFLKHINGEERLHDGNILMIGLMPLTENQRSLNV
jgi:hypothetical protein